MENEIQFDIIDYMGQLDGGIFVLMNLNYQSENYEAIFYYRETIVSLTPDPKLEEKIGSEIEDYWDYSNLMMRIIKKLVPYRQMINIVNDFDPNVYRIDFTK